MSADREEQDRAELVEDIAKAAKDARAVHDAKMRSGDSLVEARCRFLASVIIAVAPGLPAICDERVFSGGVKRVFTLARYQIDDTRTGVNHMTRSLYVTETGELWCDTRNLRGPVIEDHSPTYAEAIADFGANQKIERGAHDLLHAFTKVAQGNGERRAREFEEKAKRIESLCTLILAETKR